MNAEIDKYIKELRSATNTAWLNYEIWWVYKSSDTRLQYVETMNHYLMFFSTSIHAHFVAMLVALYRLYEHRTDICNILKLLKLLEKEGKIPSETQQRLAACHAEAKPLWLKVGVLRNEVFGHRTNERNVTEAFEKANVTPDELRNLILKTRALLNIATQARSRETHMYNLTSREDTIRLLEAIRRNVGGQKSVTD